MSKTEGKAAPAQPAETAGTGESVTAVAPTQPNDGDFPLTLTEFCTQLSSKDKRVALIGGFHHTETAAGTIKDTVAAFTTRYEAFINQPA
jgi:hypothetical protein